MVKIFWRVSGLYGANFDGSVFGHVKGSCRSDELCVEQNVKLSMGCLSRNTLTRRKIGWVVEGWGGVL